MSLFGNSTKQRRLHTNRLHASTVVSMSVHVVIWLQKEVKALSYKQTKVFTASTQTSEIKCFQLQFRGSMATMFNFLPAAITISHARLRLNVLQAVSVFPSVCHSASQSDSQSVSQ